MDKMSVNDKILINNLKKNIKYRDQRIFYTNFI